MLLPVLFGCVVSLSVTVGSLSRLQCDWCMLLPVLFGCVVSLSITVGSLSRLQCDWCMELPVLFGRVVSLSIIPVHSLPLVHSFPSGVALSRQSAFALAQEGPLFGDVSAHTARSLHRRILHSSARQLPRYKQVGAKLLLWRVITLAY